MFDQETEKLLRAAPSLSDFDANELPQILTKQYAELVIKRANSESDSYDLSLIIKIAETYEIASFVEKKADLRKSCAFVAATAYQLLYQIDTNETSTLTQDQINPIIIATVLFLLSEQYADAREAAKKIPKNNDDHIIIKTLCETISSLASGNLHKIIDRTLKINDIHIKKNLGLEIQATLTLYLEILKGIETFVSYLVGETTSEWDRTFFHVMEHSVNEYNLPFNKKLITRYLGPKHLAYLLKESFKDLKKSALIDLIDENNAQGYFWNTWIRTRVKKAPFIWQNHKEAIEKRFYETGKSAVLIFPTGSRKTTISSLKIANT